LTTTSKRGVVERQDMPRHWKDALVIRTAEGVRFGVFVNDHQPTVIQAAVDTPDGGVVCFGIPFAEFIDYLRARATGATHD
jgi:hypothetical protein